MNSPFISKIRCHSPNFGKKTAVKNYNYLYYIATREGVDLGMLAEKYKVFENGSPNIDNQIYLKYIHERPRSHGLFGNIPVSDLNGLCTHVKNLSYTQPIFRCIFSLSESDANRLGYVTKDKWKELLDYKLDAVAYELGINRDDLVWIGAFHNEKSHPHVHCMLWSKSNDYAINPYISIPKQHKCREILSKQIFKEDYELYLHQKNALRDSLIKEVKNDMPSYLRLSNKDINAMSDSMIKLIDILPDRGNLMYKYLPEDSKKAIHDVLKHMFDAKSELKTAYDNYLIECLKLAEIYSPTQKELEIARQKAKKDIDTRLYNIILKAVKSLKKDEYAFYEAVQSSFSKSDMPPDTQDKMENHHNFNLTEKDLVKSGLSYLYGKHGVEKDVKLGLEYLNKAKQKGSTFADQVMDSFYGISHLYGKNEFEKNLDLGLEYLNKAKQKGSDFADQVMDSFYGISYLYGKNGFEKNLDLGLQYLNKAEQNGSKFAGEFLNTYLGTAYLYGRMGMKKDIQKGIEYLKNAKDEGSAFADEILNIFFGNSYLHGRDGFEKNVNLGLEYLNKAKDEGSAFADEILNIYYGISYLSGKDGLEKNIELGREYLDKAKKNGSQYAAHAFNHYFGIAYLYGRDGYDKDIKLGLKHLNEAKDEGSTFAGEIINTYLGVAYLYGRDDFEKNVKLGLEHLEEAKNNGSAFASEVINTYLGVAYLYGRDDFEKNVKLGLEHLEEAKNNGSAFASEVINTYLGVAYLYGKDGFEKNVQLGLEYLEEAKNNGSAFASEVIHSYNSFIENRLKSKVYSTVNSVFNSIITNTKLNRIFYSNYDSRLDYTNVKLNREIRIKHKGKRDNNLHDYSLDR